ncbi:hypothetical protein TWF694_005641 [Orbilia ellipsospora]|uniref:Histone H2A n=1 Tax=Orbilia ellipsospora TaxID=2528407 RepID=A0AAV9WUY2_9PEZI
MMGSRPKVFSTFKVESGSLCFGALHNIWSGSTLPVQQFPLVRPQLSGTVAVHPLEHNIVAKRGTWNVFQLVDTASREVCGWFVSHTDVNPVSEVDKILRISGSPYEEDCGSTMNDENTYKEKVLVINRYDWGYYRKQFFAEIGEGVPEGNNDFLANSNSAGLVDYSQAQSQVNQWKELRPSKRAPSGSGVWMYSPNAEYMFGRFGFDEDGTAALSFLFFSINTVFPRTSFDGLQTTVRKVETHEERFQRKLAEGYDFSGIQDLHKISKPQGQPGLSPWASSPPPKPLLLGPYDPCNHIFFDRDIDALHFSVCKSLSQPENQFMTFAAPWRGAIYKLLNELTLSWIEKYIVPNVPNHKDTQTVADSLFLTSMNTGQNLLGKQSHSRFLNPSQSFIDNFDTNAVQGRLTKFLISRSQEPTPPDNEYTTGLCGVLIYFISEVLELAIRSALDSSRPQLTPYDIRMAIYFDNELLNILQYSAIFWDEGN